MVNEVAGYHEQMRHEAGHVVFDRVPGIEIETLAEVQIGQMRNARDHLLLPRNQRNDPALSYETKRRPAAIQRNLYREAAVCSL
jgi:hypothetical protein